MNFRSSSYTINEDIHLCEIYVDVSQDPIVGASQPLSRLWSRVETDYNNTLPNTITGNRNAKSLRDRWSVIKSAVSKLLACIVQVERDNPSGASKEDIMNRAKILMMQDPKYSKKGFMFDHVFNITKDYVNVGNKAKRRNNNPPSSQSDASVPDSPIFSSPGISPFNISLSDDNDGGTSSMRPEGLKKAKHQRKTGEDASRVIKCVEEANKRIGDLWAESNIKQDRVIDEIAKKRNESAKRREENAQRRDDSIMFVDLETIPDPARREWFRNEQLKIMQKSSHQYQPQNSSNTFGHFYDMGGSGSGLPEY